MLLTPTQIIIRLLLATLIGFIFGLERERNRKPAGARTHVLVCIAACLVAIISAYGFGADAQMSALRSDPARLMVGIFTGIGFLGAGIIWKTPSGSVQGITTAAEILLLASLGISCGLGHYFLTLCAATIAFLAVISDPLLVKLVAKLTPKEKDEQQVNE